MFLDFKKKRQIHTLEHWAKIRSAVVFKGNSLGGSGIWPVCRQVGNSQSRLRMPGGSYVGLSPRFLVFILIMR